MSLAVVLALVGMKMLTHGGLKSLLGPNSNLYLLLVVLGILVVGVVASWLHRPGVGSSSDGNGTEAA